MDSAQLSAWLTRGHQALQDTIPSRTRKQFAGLMLDSGLWSSERLTQASAITRVGDCLHPERGGGQSFKLSELWLWMHESGNHALHEAINDDLSYRKPEPIPTAQRQQELLTRVDEKLSSISAELAELLAFRDQITGAPSVKPVPSTAAPVRFSKYDIEGGAF